MKNMATSLWFDNNAEEAVEFYTSLFKNSKIKSKAYYGPNQPGPEGSVMTVSFELLGSDFIAINGGPHFKFTPAISLVAYCDTQDEIDTLWAKLKDGGQEQQCGWVQDKYGLCWQIVPAILNELVGSNDNAKANNTMQALLGMVKLDIAKLKEAYAAG